MPQSKEEKKEYDRIRYLEKQESIKARVKEHYVLNCESIKAYQKNMLEKIKKKLPNENTRII